MTVAPLSDWDLVAHNTATESDNKIHDDEVARRFGFSGGLVPGVDVYAYLTHPPAEAWGVDWLAKGTMRARFHSPVYDGDHVTVVVIDDHTDAQGARATLELRNSLDAVCATAEATLPSAAPPPVSVERWPSVGQVSERPPASPESLAIDTLLGLAPHGFHADRASAYLDDVRETLPLYQEQGVAHPGWLLRDANYVLAGNVRLGPWIHVESYAQHHRPVRDRDTVEARALVANEWEHKGHRFVTLDVGILANTELAVRVTHTAIYAPRQVG